MPPVVQHTYMVCKAGAGAPFIVGQMIQLAEPNVAGLHNCFLMECLGQSLDAAEFPELFDLIGHTYDDYNDQPLHDPDGSICMDGEALERWITQDDSFRLPNMQAVAYAPGGAP